MTRDKRERAGERVRERERVTRDKRERAGERVRE